MKKVKFLLSSLCMLCIVFIGSSFISVDQGGNNGQSGFTHMNSLDCTSCHSALHSGSATTEEYIQMGHPVEVSFFEDYIANYTQGSPNSSGVDINRLTQFIESL